MKRLLFLLFSSIIIPGALAQNAVFNVAGGNVVVSNSGYLVLHDTKFNSDNSFTATSGTILFSGTAADGFNSISGNNPHTFYNLTVNKTANNFLVGQDITINNTLNLLGGKVIPQSYYGLTVGSAGSISNAGSARYISTANGFGLKRTVGSTLVSFPVGNSSYNPITIQNTGTSDIIGVAVSDEVLLNGTSGSAKTDYVVNRTWTLTEAVSGGSNLNVTPQWNGSEELTSFNRSTANLKAYYSNSWQNLTNTTLSGSGPYTKGATGLTTLGPLAFFSEEPVDVQSVTSNLATFYDSNVGNTFTLSIRYSTQMNTGITPVVSFPTSGENPVSAGILVPGTGTWANSTTFQQNYTIADPNVEIQNIDVQVSGGMSSIGSTQTPVLTANLFSAFMAVQPPIVTPSTTCVIDDHAGANKFWLTFTFDSPMNTTVLPVVSFPDLDPVTPGNLTAGTGTWASNTSFVQYYNVTDMNNFIGLTNSDDLIRKIFVKIEGAQLANGTPQAAYTQDGNFIVANALQPPKIIGSKFDNKYRSLYIEFDASSNYANVSGLWQHADSTIYLDFYTPGEDPLTYASIGGYLFISRYYLKIIIVEKTGMKGDLRNIDFAIRGMTLGRKDEEYITRSEFIRPDGIDVDFWRPEVRSVTPSLTNIADQNIGTNAFNIVVKFANTASGTIQLSFPTTEENPDSGLVFNHGLWNYTDSTYTAFYDVNRAGLNLSDIDLKITGAEDRSAIYNLQSKFWYMNDTVFTDVFSMNVPLPVSLSRFEAKYVKDKVELIWATETEKNNAGFEIQRSVDGRNFERIGFIDGNGTSTSSHIYTFSDYHYLPGLSYYRLKQKDFNGASEYSKIVQVNQKSGLKAQLTLYPNPVAEHFTVQYSGTLPAQATIYNSLGQPVTRFNIKGEKEELSTKGLPAGRYAIYLLDYEGNGATGYFLKQ